MKHYKTLVISVILIAGFGPLSSQQTIEDIMTTWDTIREFEQAKDYVGIITTLSGMEESYRTIKTPDNRISQEIRKIRNYQLPMDTLIELLDSTDFLLAKAYEYHGIRTFFTGDRILGEQHMSTSMKIAKLHNKSYSASQFLGSMNNMLGDYTKSVDYYTESIQAANDYFLETDYRKLKHIQSVNLGLASVHTALGDTKSAKKCIAESMIYAKKMNDDIQIAKVLIAQMTLESSQLNHDYVIELIEEHQDLLNKLDSYNQMRVFNIKGRALTGLSRYEEAIIALEKSMSLGSTMSTNVIGQCYSKLGQPSKSIPYYNKSIELYKKSGNKSGLADSYYLRAESYKEMGETERASQDLSKAISMENINKEWKVTYYPALANTYLDAYVRSKDASYLDSVQQTLATVEKLINELKIERRYFDGQAEVGARILDVYGKNINILSRLYEEDPSLIDEEKLFAYFENLKANSLREQLKTDEAVLIGNIPESILETERHFQLQIRNLQEKLYNLDSKDQFSDDAISLQKEISLVKDKYYLFLESLEEDYPGYYKHEYKNKLSSIFDIQDYLHDEYLLEYFVSEDHIFSILISSDSYQLIRKNKPDDWKDNITLFRENLQNPGSSPSEFIRLSSYFYELLAKDQLNNITSEITKLRIVPDDLINFIPFEILLNKEATTQDFKKLPYLLNRFNISYSQSADLLVQLLKKKQSHSTLNYAGFAPNYDNDLSDSLSILIYENTREGHLDLPYARESVNQISDLMNGKKYINNAATKSSFLKYAPQVKVIHMAMHGFIDLEKPAFSSLLFYGDQSDAHLYLSEVFGLNLDADLAVLSACNTGVGKLINGDGIQNMSRAFSFAGVKNTIMSLWSVPDVQTSEISYQFFQNVNEQIPIDEALRKSKQHYLKNCSSLRAHPYYWAGLVANGSMEAIHFSTRITGRTMMLIVGLLIVVFILARLFAQQRGQSPFLQEDSV